ncbi:hypothetical protein [Halomicronema hongdechloris]|nr:hypothetical protein [Halomicronema hongdechloris]
MGDRYHWAWGLIDFGNASFQGMAHGFARLWSHQLWPYPTTQEHFVRRIDALFQATAYLTRRDGSVEEAFPNEGSFCVTALVAFDLLCTIDLLSEEISAVEQENWRRIVQPLIEYLQSADETHALISNHLATAVAALARWHDLTGDPEAEQRAEELLTRILCHQSQEGWFLEYEGADPGYQSLCTYYLADVHKLRPAWDLQRPLQNSLSFLRYFAHPDGSFGGLYGSRCTRFYYPAGPLALSSDIPAAMALSRFMVQSIAQNRVVTLTAMDDPNLIPMFNAYCWAATLAKNLLNHTSDKFDDKALLSHDTLPAEQKQRQRQYFPEAGLLIDRGKEHYSIISTHKGGVVYHFKDTKLHLLNAGVVVRNAKGQLGSSQAYQKENRVTTWKENSLSIEAPIVTMPKVLPQPWQFLVLRILSLTLFRFKFSREWIKQQLVRQLITNTKLWPIRNRRTIHLGRDLTVSDELTQENGFHVQATLGSFVPIHMASQGYWQIQDEISEPPGQLGDA